MPNAQCPIHESFAAQIRYIAKLRLARFSISIGWAMLNQPFFRR
ncbi:MULTISPECIES: hypothetical protein [Calothrix]|nr:MULTISPECIES: hypothetical protein [Calothrix]